MHGFAVVAERLLRKAFRVAALLGSLCPCVAIAVERDSGAADAATASRKCFGPPGFIPTDQRWKQGAFLGQRLDYPFNILAEVEQGRGISLSTSVGNGAVVPIDVIGR